MNITFDTPGNLGDWLCLVSAAREYARRHPMDTVHIANLSDVVSLYNDKLIHLGQSGRHLVVNAEHREKNCSVRRNYLGTFLRELVPQITRPTTLDLPSFPRSTNERIAIIQPRSTFADNPPIQYVQELVHEFIKRTGERLYAVGNLSTPRELEGVDYSLLCDSVPQLLRYVSNAAVALTPRSATAHVAAAYGIPTFVWVPDDGENWHLDYPGWPRHLHYFKLGSADALDVLGYFLESECGVAPLKSIESRGNAVVTINIGNVLESNARDSFLEAARRWNCEYHEITTLPLGAEHPFYCKFWLFDLIDAERIFYIDADAVIRGDAPSPFSEFLETDTLYAVKDLGPDEVVRAEARRALEVMHFSLDISLYFNSGVMLLSRSAHASLLMELREFQGGWIWPDQTPLNVLAQRAKLSLMPRTWNDIRPGDVNVMSSFVYHYARNPGRHSQLPLVIWRTVNTT